MGKAAGLTDRGGHREERAGDARECGADPECERLVAREAHARGHGCRLAVPHRAERAPGAPAEDQPRDDEPDERERPAEVVQPLVRRERHAEHVDVRRRSRQLGQPGELDPLARAGPLLEAPQSRRRRDGDRERRERQVEPGEAQSGKPKRVSRTARRRAPRRGSSRRPSCRRRSGLRTARCRP